MKGSVVQLVGLVAVLFLGLTGGGNEKKNPHVKVDVTIEPSSLKPGGRGEILIQFQPVDGIHINTAPPTEFNLAEGSPLTLVGEPIVPKDSTTGYLDARKPMRYTVSVSKSARSGSMKVSGTLVYYFCSDKEGWCLRWKENVTLILSFVR